MSNCISKNNIVSEFENFYGEYIKSYNINDVIFGCFWLVLFGYYEKGKGALKFKNEIINFIIEDGKFIYDIDKLIKNLENVNIEINNYADELGSHVSRVWESNNLKVNTLILDILNEFSIDGIFNFQHKINYVIDRKIKKLDFRNFYDSYIKYIPNQKNKNKLIHYFSGTFVFDWLKVMYYSNIVDGNTLPELSFIIKKASKPVKSGLIGEEYDFYNKKHNDILLDEAKKYESKNNHNNIFELENNLCEIGKKFYK